MHAGSPGLDVRPGQELDFAAPRKPYAVSGDVTLVPVGESHALRMPQRFPAIAAVFDTQWRPSGCHRSELCPHQRPWRRQP